MDPSEQQPQPQATPAGANEEVFEQQETPPLYEFAHLNPQTDETPFQPEATPATDVQQPEESLSIDPRILEQAVREGRIYPPPPAYYENMSFQSSNEQAAFSAITTNSAQPAPPSYPPPRPAYPPPYQTPRGGTARRSRTWVWIVVVVLSVGLVGCGLLSWGAYTIFSTAYQSASGSIQVVEDFYSNLQSQDYQAAYHDLDMPKLTLAQFTQQAQQADLQNGAIQSYELQQPSISISQNAPDISHFSYTVQVTRPHASYSALIEVSQEGKSWKITNFDHL